MISSNNDLLASRDIISAVKNQNMAKKKKLWKPLFSIWEFECNILNLWLGLSLIISIIQDGRDWWRT